MSDPFDLHALALARPAEGYAVQYLGRDEILDRKRRCFLSIRDPALSGLFSRYSEAATALAACSPELPLAIVPAAFDVRFGRHVLICGVLTPEPDTLPLYIQAVSSV